MIHGQLLPQPVCALAQRADPAPDRGDLQPDGAGDALDKACVEVATQGGARRDVTASKEPNTTRGVTATRRRRRPVCTTGAESSWDRGIERGLGAGLLLCFHRHTTKRGRTRVFNAALHALRRRVERTCAWAETCKRLLLRLEHLQQRH